MEIIEIEKRNGPFYRIDKAEILNGVRLSSKNAKKLFDSALSVKKLGGNQGLANSLLILAGEESIKAFVLVAVLANIKLPFLIDLIFSKHTVKHARGKEMNQVVDFMSVIIDIIPLKRSKAIRPFRDTIRRLFSISNKDEWWNRANLDKNRGLYVNYSSNRFVAPLDVSDSEFEESVGVVSQYVKLMEIIAETGPEDFSVIIELSKSRSI